MTDSSAMIAGEILRKRATDLVVDESLKNAIAQALREARREGMMEAAEILKSLGKEHRNMVPVLLKTNPAMAEMQKIRAEECEIDAQAIERAAEFPAMDTNPEK